jgi:hypothetical protein
LAQLVDRSSLRMRARPAGNIAHARCIRVHEAECRGGPGVAMGPAS